MVESGFALNKFSKAVNQYNYLGEKGFNLETINGYNNLDEISSNFELIDYVTVGRVDFVSSLQKDRAYVNDEKMYEMVSNIFTTVKKYNNKCYLGCAISIDSKDFIKKLVQNDLLDKFETRYIMFDTKQINIDELEKLLYLANVFEVEWLKFISERYHLLFNKDTERIKMIEERLKNNNINK
jgi:hypothetical protein